MSYVTRRYLILYSLFLTSNLELEVLEHLLDRSDLSFGKSEAVDAVVRGLDRWGDCAEDFGDFEHPDVFLLRPVDIERVAIELTDAAVHVAQAMHEPEFILVVDQHLLDERHPPLAAPDRSDVVSLLEVFYVPVPL